MKFECIVNVDADKIMITLKGALDATNAIPFMEEMKKLIGTKVSKIVMNVKELDYIASAGLRVLIFTKQKIGYDADVIMQSPQESVVSVLEMSGLNNFITIE